MNKRLQTRIDFGELKHEARLNLWRPALLYLKNSLGRPLKYFTLPGEKAYDIIRWGNEGLIKYENRGFPDLCFCDYDWNNYRNAKKILGKTAGIY